MSRLKTIDCGLYLLADENTGILALSKLNKALRDSMQTMIMSRNFSDIATSLLEIVQRFLPVQSMEFYSLASDGTMLHLAPETRFRGVVSENPPAPVAERLNTTIENWREGHRRQYTIADDGKNGAASSILLPLFDPESGRAHGIALLHADSRVENSEELEQLIETVALPLDIAVTRETAYRMLDLAAEKFYRQSTRDPLTGLYTRLYMQETVGRLIQLHDRDANARIGLMMADIDHFKKVNDTFGHNQGDVVLKRMAEIFRSMVRESDIPVRFGGEEFAIFVVGPAVGELTAIAERMRLAVEGMTLEDPMAGHRITVSFGVAVHQQGESLTDFIDRADEALYRAKETGRNRICKAEESGTPTQS